MNTGSKDHDNDDVSRTIERKQNRKLRARRNAGRRDYWIGLSMFGLIGWSVVIPTLILTAVGLWMDDRTEGSISWTLTGILIGVILGSLNAWYWIQREDERE